ncbi:Retrovirus-related Pol polyprotein from transposon RE2-like protein [Drosera capensis]
MEKATLEPHLLMPNAADKMDKTTKHHKIKDNEQAVEELIETADKEESFAHNDNATETEEQTQQQLKTNEQDKRRWIKAHTQEIEPKIISEALNDQNWVDATQEELNQFQRNEGYSQEEGIDFDKTFAPIARLEAIRMFLAYAAYQGFKVYQIDVKNAFLNGKLQDEVYVKQPPRFEDSEYPEYVYRLDMALYGLEQPPRALYETLSTFLCEINLREILQVVELAGRVEVDHANKYYR